MDVQKIALPEKLFLAWKLLGEGVVRPHRYSGG